MSGKDGKRTKGRRNLYSHTKNTLSNSSSVQSRVGAFGLGITTPTSIPFKPFGSSVTMNVNDVATEFGFTLKSSHEDAVRITELMDAPVDLDLPVHAISRGPNPYLDRCMYCNTPRTTSQDGDEGLELLDLQLDGNTVISSPANPQSYSSLKLEIWTCVNCRKVAGNFQSFLEANFPQASYDLPFLHERCIDPLTCARCQEERECHERETQELQENWVELRSIVKDLYSRLEEPVLSEQHGERLQLLVDKLCSRDPHQLFLRLESQVREIVMDMKVSLLIKLKENGCDSPGLALDFTSSLLSHYELLTKKSHLLAQYLGGLSEHLRRFKVTWELLNKHLFHSIAHNDPAISNSGPTILEQLRQGSVQYERAKDDPYCTVRKRLLKFQEEMSVVVVVWRDCQQLIENYCQEEVKNTQKQVSSKARSFISQQRQFLKEHLMKEPLMDKALSETMKNLMSGHKTSTEKVLCHQCKRERCTCDECTITHMITCGIINSDKGEIPPPPNSFSFALDHTRNIMDITPPSMSSTTSSSGSVSPINLEDKLTTFYDCERVLHEDFRDEFSDALLTCSDREGKASSLTEDTTDDIDDNAGDDEEEDDDDVDEDDFTDNQDAGSDEPHALQIPICELKDEEELWEAVKRRHHQQQLLQHQHHHHICDKLSTQHNCASCHQLKQDQQCPFQPRIDPELSRQLDAELAKSGLLPGGAGDYGRDAITENGEATADGQGSGDNINTNVCATCQCHACLNQSGHVISTSLPLQMPVSPSPSELHLYPHIHGLPQHNPQQYMSDLTTHLSSIKLPVKLDFNDTSSSILYHAYSDWDNTLARPGSLAAQHHQQHHRLSALSTDLPPPLVTSASSFTFDYASHLATHTTNTSTTNTTSAFKSVAGKHFASSILPTLNNLESTASEGSSVDPSKPLDFASLAKIPQSCLNSANSLSPSAFSLSSSFSCPSSSLNLSSSIPGVPVTAKSIGPCHGPPHCSRPPTLGGNPSSKWERSPLPSCKKLSAGSGVFNKQMSGGPAYNLGVVPFTGGLQAPPAMPTSQAAPKNPFSGHHHKDEVLRSLRSCSHTTNSTPRPGGLTSHVNTGAPSITTNTTSTTPTTNGQSVTLSCNNSLSTIVNNIGVGTITTPCNDPDCEANHPDDNCDSVDDSSYSDKSSSTSTSNQKEGKYCDCCYCEFFGHNTTQVAKTSTNYIEMKDRLRKKLKKRQSESKHKQIGPKNGLVQEGSREDLKDPLEKKGLEGLLSFINGTDDNQSKAKEKELTPKAAKRARQKQKKLEEKARQVKSNSPNDKNHQLEPEKTLRQLLLNQTLTINKQSSAFVQLNMSKSKAKRAQYVAGKKDISVDVPVDKVESPDSVTSLKQEINRSSLIIESTRSTINPTAKNLASVQQKCSNNSKDTPQHILGVINSVKQQQQNKAKSISLETNPSSILSLQVKSNGTAIMAPVKVTSEFVKTNGQTKQQENQPIQRANQHKQGKALNGKMATPSQPAGNHVVNGRSSSNDKKAQVQINGTSHKSQASTPVTTMPLTGTGSLPTVSKNVLGSPSAGSESSTSQSPSCGTKVSVDQGKANGKTKKNKKKNKNGDLNGVDEIFMPKSESELDGDVDEFERELEEFKRFCFEPAEPKERRKIAVNVNLKDIFKKKTGLV